ncbi:glycosyltransferase family 2 protein [Candidatus Woesearchaeota archaeon]|nr:glycosyltransferase family 2 protein [Candidatus Woesearchaeota archaeon]
MAKLSLSVVIPAYNEEKRIGKTLRRITSYLDKRKDDYEIIVVDDCSKDNTVKVARFLKNKRLKVLKNKCNLGKGGAVKNGMLAAKKKYVLFSDADLSTPIEEIEKFEKLKDKYDILIGSRALKESDIKIKQPFYRVLMGKTFNLIVNLLVIWGVKDTQCGFKWFRKDAVKKIFPKQTFNGFSFDVELLFIAKKYGYSIKEVPVTWLNSPDSKVSAVRDSIRMFMDLIKIRINDLRGKY